MFSTSFSSFVSASRKGTPRQDVLEQDGAASQNDRAEMSPKDERSDMSPKNLAEPSDCIERHDSARRVTEWQAEMESIDQQQGQLLNSQWKLTGKQIAECVIEIAEMREQMSSLKSNALTKDGLHREIEELTDVKSKMMTKEVEDVIETLLDGQKLYGRNQTSVTERLASLEKLLAGSTEKTGMELQDARISYEENITTMQMRLEYIEHLVGDNTDKNLKAVEDAQLKLKELSSTGQSLQGALDSCAKLDTQATMQERLDYLEKFIGESADQSAQAMRETMQEHKTTMETRLGYLEALIGDNADNYSKEIDSARCKLDGNVQDLKNAVAQCATAEHHCGLQERVTDLEKHQAVCVGKHEDLTATVHQRLAYLEALIASNADKIAQELVATNGSLQGMEAALQVVTSGAMEERVTYLESFLGESADQHARDLVETRARHAEYKTAMEVRLDRIEGLLGTCADSNLDAQAKLEAISSQGTSLGGRCDEIQQIVADLIGQHAQSLRELDETAHAGLSDLSGSFLENKVSNEGLLATIQDRLDSMDVQGRLDSMERLLGDATGNVPKQFQAFEANYKNLKIAHDELSGLYRRSESTRDSNHNTMDDRVSYMQSFITEFFDKYAKELETAQSKLREVNGKVAAFENSKAAMEQRCDYLSTLLTEQSTKSIDMTREMDKRLLQMQDDQKRARDMIESSLTASYESIRSTTEQRLENFENIISESTVGKGDLTKEIEKRFQWMQQDAQRTRETMEKYFHEQLSLEHASHDSMQSQIKEQWDREQRARQAGFENYKDLLSNERGSREAGALSMDSRIEAIERSLMRETQHIWTAIDGHTHESTATPRVDTSPRNDRFLDMSVEVPTSQPRPRSALVPPLLVQENIEERPRTLSLDMTSPINRQVPAMSGGQLVLTSPVASPYPSVLARDPVLPLQRGLPISPPLPQRSTRKTLSPPRSSRHTLPLAAATRSMTASNQFMVRPGSFQVPMAEVRPAVPNGTVSIDMSQVVESPALSMPSPSPTLSATPSMASVQTLLPCPSISGSMVSSSTQAPPSLILLPQSPRPSPLQPPRSVQSNYREVPTRISLGPTRYGVLGMSGELSPRSPRR